MTQAGGMGAVGLPHQRTSHSAADQHPEMVADETNSPALGGKLKPPMVISHPKNVAIAQARTEH